MAAGGAERYFTRWYKPESVSSPWQKPILFFKVEKQLKALITKSVPTVADSRIRCLGSQKGISSSDGEEYTIYSCIRGRLIEVNENILSNPAILQEKVRHFLAFYFLTFISLLTSVLLFSHQPRDTSLWFYPNLKKARV
ncbi:protein Abitram isoform X2 [Strix uralensis]|uniref:protein Abitram isoform X2 n=1 Tax=Strix uralensis TaxID=36305 RepID=UPI003DA515E2